MRKFTFRWLLSLLVMTGFAFNSNAQYLTESFEGAFPPTDWAIVNNGSGNDWIQSTSTASDGSNSMQYGYNGSNAADTWAFTKAITLTAGTNIQIYFDYEVASATYPEKLKLTVGSDQTVANQTTILWDNNGGSDLTNTSFETAMITYTVPADGDYYFAFNCYSDANQFNLFVDNVIIQDEPSCTSPDALTALNIMPTSADLNWNETGSATTWDVEWDVAGFAPTGTPTNDDVASTTLNVTGLTSGQAYDYYVRADCGSDNVNVSTWVGPYTFVYLVGDNCSNAQDLSTMTSPFSGTTVGYTASDISGMTCAAADNGSANRIFFIDVADGVELHIGQTANAFDSRHNVAYGASCPGDQEIVCSDDPDTEEVVWLNTTGSTQRVYYVLAGYGSSSAGTFDFAWSLVTCPDPTTLGTANLTATSVDLTWTTGGASNWDIEYGATPFTPTGTPTIDNTTDNPYNLTGLTPETTYEFYVRDDCGADNVDTSNWVGPFSFTTTASCPAPSDLSAAPMDVSADLSWNGYAASNWDIEWGVTGFTPTGTPTINDTPNNPENISGLTPQTAYDFYVRADCGSDNIDTSIWVGPFTFTTECSPITAPFTEDFENAGAIPSCWKQGTTNSEDWMFDNDVTNPGHVGNAGNVGGTTSASGGYFAWVDDSSPNNIGTTMESPLIDLSALTVPALSFYMISNNEGSENAELQVDAWDGSTWTNVFTNKANTNNWELKVADLSAFSGTIKLRFVVNEDAAGNWYDDIAIDDISVREISSETDILTYSFPEQTGAATIDAAAHTVNIEVGNGTDLTTLIADFTLSTGATAAIGGVAQVSGTTANDFSGGSLTYDVTAEDGTTTQAWTVTVTEAPINTETDILTYSFAEQTGAATIDATAHTVNIEVNSCADLTNLVATFTLSYGANAAIAGTAQVSGTTTNDFSAPVTYDVTAEDGTTTQAWTVSVTQAAAPAEVSCSTPAAYTINGADYTNALCSSTPLYVEVTLDQDYTNVRFETCGSDFDTKLAYFANCADITDDMTTSPSNPTNSLGYNDDNCGLQSGIDVATLSAGTYIACLYGYGTASGNIQFRVTGTPASDAEILSYTIPNQVSSDIFAANDSISVLMPQGTDVTALIADFTLSTNATVTVATVAQVSGTTPNDWTTNPVDYLVTGEDGITTRTWHVWVTTNVGINNIIDSKDVTVYPNPNNGQFNIALNLNVNKVNMEVVNALGQVVAKFNDIDASSTQTISLDQVAEGMYYIRISSENNTIIKKVNVIK